MTVVHTYFYIVPSSTYVTTLPTSSGCDGREMMGYFHFLDLKQQMNTGHTTQSF